MKTKFDEGKIKNKTKQNPYISSLGCGQGL
jgi:hypothetical protein